MKASDLDLRELLNAPEDGGVLLLGPVRTMLVDPASLGVLRKELIETLGWAGARVVLSRFGFAQGWNTAERFREEFPWDSRQEWILAGDRLHALMGHVREEGGSEEEGLASHRVWKDSWEAEQHLLHHGRAEEPVCWVSAGFVSGYLSCAHGRELRAREVRCRGKGDAACQVTARPAEAWSPIGGEDAHLYARESLRTALTAIAESIKNAERTLRKHVRQIRTATSAEIDPSGIVAASDAMRRTLDMARRVARVDSSVLVTGESGVGKERVGRLIHEESERADGPFVAVNCAAVTETLLESELFGHARGSFTGATQDRPGLFEAAHRGTIFLDEIGEIPQSMQVKLLRVLQEQEVRRVGENRPRKIDARVIAATNRDLAEDVQSGRFRDDLYYRLRVIELRIPALRDRRQDVLPLARRALAQIARKMERRIDGFTPAAADQLLRYSWPGNVRELQNAVEHAVVLANGSKIDVGDLPEEVRLSKAQTFSLDLSRPLAEVERDYILTVLERNRGNQKRTAEQLGIGTATLYRRLRSFAKERSTGGSE
jgi:DNA-binding NtrC family response regulator